MDETPAPAADLRALTNRCSQCGTRPPKWWPHGSNSPRLRITRAYASG